MSDPRQARIRRVLWAVLALNLVVAGAKIAYGLFANSIAIQADALHSTFDGLANLVGLAAMAMASAAPDPEHPYGHHRFEMLGALGIAAMIGATAGGIAWQAVLHIGEPSTAHVEPGGLVLLGLLACVSLGISLFGIPFIVGSVFILTLALMSVCGKVEVTVSGGETTVFSGVGSLGWRRRLDWTDVATIEEGPARSACGSGHGLGIIMEGSTRLSFGSGLNEKRHYFLLQGLKYLRSRSG